MLFHVTWYLLLFLCMVFGSLVVTYYLIDYNNNLIASQHFSWKRNMQKCVSTIQKYETIFNNRIIMHLMTIYADGMLDFFRRVWRTQNNKFVFSMATSMFLVISVTFPLQQTYSFSLFGFSFQCWIAYWRTSSSSTKKFCCLTILLYYNIVIDFKRIFKEIKICSSLCSRVRSWIGQCLPLLRIWLHIYTVISRVLRGTYLILFWLFEFQ